LITLKEEKERIDKKRSMLSSRERAIEEKKKEITRT